MPGICTVCNHPDRAEIDNAIGAGGSNRTIARHFSDSKDAIARHQIDHLPALLTHAAPVKEEATRHLFVLVRRSKELPHGGALSDADVAALAHCVRDALSTARRRGTLARDDETNRMWEVVYSALTAERPGMFGAITARAEAHVLRLSLIYALLDGAEAIRRPHLEAALTVWQYCEESARFIFGDAIGDSIADRVLSALRSTGPMSQNELRDLFGQHVRAAALGRALETLVAAGKAMATQVETGGQPRTMWEAR